MSAPRVLLVDDEPKVLSALKRLLHRERFDVVTTTSPEDVPSLMGEASYAVVVSDHRMPGMEGPELLEKVREASPDTIRIMLTGCADVQTAMEAINRGAVYRFLTKPWNDEELRITVRQGVSQYELVSENRRLEGLIQKQNEELKDLNQNLERKVELRTEEISRLNAELEKSFVGSVQVLAGLAEMHSTVIGSHSKRVRALSKEVAARLGLSGRDLFQVEIAAALHDIGKIGISPDILRKPEASLGRHEQAVYQRHPVQGEAVVRMVPDLGEASRLIRHHHERFDGRGFPDHLQGHKIPVGSRVIAAVDAYDKALNTRSLFASATPEKALRFVRGRVNDCFDLEVASALSHCLKEGNVALEDGVEVEVRLADLREGMVLSRELRTSRGVLLLPGNCRMRKEHLSRLLKYHEQDPIVEGIRVYRGGTVAAPVP